MTEQNKAARSAERRHLTLSSGDNVTTVLDDLVDASCLAGGGAVVPGVRFGHKVALTDIAAGDSVVKYGVVIGHATQPIAKGEHVHVHNCC
ncbi:UxaA family hydrolase [Afipia birgiae]|uniref:UxaA family hydrolase n=1 Tax=Afipia birgiae TaxID=151414 RepID=UPI0009EA384C|nr:UxaA family hydrolase [Afipia birgiae]MBX9820166.1 UxaA family hydrolase [Afipia birgiae]